APEKLAYHARHRGESAASLVALYGPKLGEMTEFSMTGTASQKGSLAALTAKLAKAKGITNVIIEGPHELWVVIGEDDDDGTWHVRSARGYQGTDEAWLAKLVGIRREAPAFPGLVSAAVERQATSMSSFVPEPPIARANHAVLTTDAEVAAA